MTETVLLSVRGLSGRPGETARQESVSPSSVSRGVRDSVETVVSPSVCGVKNNFNISSKGRKRIKTSLLQITNYN